MVKKSGFLLLVAMLVMGSTAWAQNTELSLSAGATSVRGSVDLKKPLTRGFMKIGIAGDYADDEDTDHQLAHLELLVGNDTLAPGLTAQVGLRTAFGSVEEDDRSGDAATVAFTARVGYSFRPGNISVPFEVFGGYSYGPAVLSFMDTESYQDLELGIGVQIVPNASIRLSYMAYDIGMEDGPGDWNFDNAMIRLGIAMRF